MIIKALAMDVDGTLTDGKMHMGEKGELFKSLHVKDGYAIHHMLPQMGIIPIIVTGRNSLIVERRCNEIGVVHIAQGSIKKVEDLKHILEELNIEWKDTAYIGDDKNDLECMKLAGVTGCPLDAVNEVKQQSDFISEYYGGCGAVREFVEWIWNKRNM